MASLENENVAVGNEKSTENKAAGQHQEDSEEVYEDFAAGWRGVRADCEKVLFYKAKYNIFKIERSNPVKVVKVAIGGKDTSADLNSHMEVSALHSTFDEMKSKMQEGNPCMVVYDFGYTLDNDNFRNMIVLICYVPDDTKVRMKVAYSSNICNIKDKLNIPLHIHVASLDDLTYDHVRSEVMRVQII